MFFLRHDIDRILRDFVIGVLAYIWVILKLIVQWVMTREYTLQHFIARLIAVEKRIRSWPKKLAFLYRWARYAIQHYRLLPGWAKITYTSMLVILIIAPFAAREYREWRYERMLYEGYYERLFAVYSEDLPYASAVFNAHKYADNFAKYYTSEAYQNALRYALPQAEKAEEIIQQAEKAPEIVRELQVTPAGLALIKEFEGLRLEPYLDVGGKYTIGYGHLMRPEDRFIRLTEAEAEALLRRDIQIAEAVVKTLVTVPLTPHQFSALVSLVYNIGGHQFKRSTLLRYLNAGNYEAAAQQMLRWEHVAGQKVRGLTRRRQAEYRLFLTQA
jgi:lysozyme